MKKNIIIITAVTCLALTAGVGIFALAKGNGGEEKPTMEVVATAVSENTSIKAEVGKTEVLTTVPETTTEITTEEQTTILETTTRETTTELVTEPETQEEDQGPTASVLFAGDLCLEEDGFVLDYYDEIGGDLSQCVSPYLLNRMSSADLFMLNHEYAMSSRGERLDKYYTFRANPSRVDILKEMSVDIVSLANNHTYDFGYDAFTDTINILRENGIRQVGAGQNASEAEMVEYFEINGIKIGFVSASRAEKLVITPKATDSQAGVFWMYDDTRLKEVIAAADSQCDFLIAYIHWGTEDSKYFERYQQNIAQELVNCGADAIIGGHPHVVQGMEFIGNVPVIYSMGDFWFNGEDKYSMMVQLVINKNGTCGVEIIPCRQRGYTINHIEDSAEQKEFFKYLSNLSLGVNFG